MTKFCIYKLIILHVFTETIPYLHFCAVFRLSSEDYKLLAHSYFKHFLHISSRYIYIRMSLRVVDFSFCMGTTIVENLTRNSRMYTWGGARDFEYEGCQLWNCFKKNAGDIETICNFPHVIGTYIRLICLSDSIITIYYLWL